MSNLHLPHWKHWKTTPGPLEAALRVVSCGCVGHDGWEKRLPPKSGQKETKDHQKRIQHRLVWKKMDYNTYNL